jgi:hypothetical protein
MSEQKQPRPAPPDDQPDVQTNKPDAFNPFAPENLRIDLNISEGVGVKKVVLTISVRKPSNQDFMRPFEPGLSARTRCHRIKG